MLFQHPQQHAPGHKKCMMGPLSWALGAQQFSVTAASTYWQCSIQVVSSTCKPGFAAPHSSLYVAVTCTLIFFPLLQVMNIAKGNNFAFLSFYLPDETPWMVQCCGLDNQGIVVEFLARLRGLFICSVKWAPYQRSVQWLLGIMWQGHEAGHSRTSIAKIRNEWSYIFTPQYAVKVCTELHLSV